MEEYRIYLLDDADRTWDYRVIHCQDDAEAMTAAADLQSGLPAMEIWVGTRMVRRLRQARIPQSAAAH